MDRISYTLGRDLEPPVPGTPARAGPQLRARFFQALLCGWQASSSARGVLWGVSGSCQAQFSHVDAPGTGVPTWFLWEFTVQ